ncbi:MAG: extensin family protein [Novosphingobium sp.]|nr:extensin family protein [Novosphingobium sp.]
MRRSAPLLATLILLAGCSAIPEAEAPRQEVRASTAFLTPIPDERQCLAALGRTQANFTPLPDQYFGAGCSTLGSVRLAGLRSDDAVLTLANLGPVACPLATAFAGWARYGVDRAARQILGSPLVRIETMGSYSCRTIAGSDRLSAHATGNAIDVSGFVLADGRRITVLRDWASDDPQTRAFFETIEQSACKRFGTVLGPNYNPAHRNHFHLERSTGRPFCR